MEVEIEKRSAQETPASVMSEFVVEHITALMTLGGIESIESKRYVSGFGSRLHVSIAPFPSAPKEVVEQGIVMKDALAQIMSVANIGRIVMKPRPEDVSGVETTWKVAVESARALNSESGYVATDGSSTGKGEEHEALSEF